MSKIRNIKLSNFKFFKEEETIKLDGKHLLLYGENGSGKSSIFWALYTLLESSIKTESETKKYFEPLANSDESLVNIFANEMSDIPSKKSHYDSYIKLEDDKKAMYELSLLENKIWSNDKVKESRKATDFINYQAIFKFQEFKNSEAPDLYKVFCNSILPYVTFSPITLKGKTFTNASDMWTQYQTGPGTIINKHGDKIQVYKKSQDYIDFESFEKHFDNALSTLVDFINAKALEMMKRLGYNIGFKLQYTSPTHVKKRKQYIHTPFKIILSITHYNNECVTVSKPHTFLNEAKMAAVATAIRLLVLDHRAKISDALNVLVLDDIMISLDMSNRDKLTTMLLNEYANKYQILFLTHDKSLYNFVDYKIKQHKQDKDWLRKEMYVGECEFTEQEFPVIIDGECSSFEKAKKYYAAKDYTTSALYIRKTLEEIIAESLSEEFCKNADGRFVELNTLWKKLIKYNSNITSEIKNLFAQSRLVILNPSVHYQKLSIPLYRRELSASFELINKLKEIDLTVRLLLLSKNSRLVFTHPSENYSFEFSVMQDMIKGANEDPICKIRTWQYNTQTFYDFTTGSASEEPLKPTETKFSKLKQNLMKTPLNINEDIFLDNTIIEEGTLREVFES